MRKLRRPVIVLLLAAGATAGCSTAGGSSTTPPPTTSRASEVQILAVAKEVAECIRNNGLQGFPDPYFEDGELKLPPVDATVEDQGQAILDGPCREVWQRLEQMLPDQQQGDKPNGDQPEQPLSADDLAKAKEFAKCIRDKGFARWPDPDPTGFFNLTGTDIPVGLGKFDRPEDAAFREAWEGCQQFWVNGIQVGAR